MKDPVTDPRTNPVSGHEAIPAPYTRLVDDAAVFPPGNATLVDAVTAHLAFKQQEYGALVGPLVVRDTMLPELGSLMRGRQDNPSPIDDRPGAVLPGGAQPNEALSVAVVVSSGAGGIGPAVAQAARLPGVRLVGLEVALRDEADLAANVRRIRAALDDVLGADALADEAVCSVELPRTYELALGRSWLDALDEIAAGEMRAKFRTGGEHVDAFPSAQELGAALEACLDREVAFKCTAGLHHAVRTIDSATGFDQHGFLNVMLATRLALGGAARDGVVDLLRETDAVQLVSLARDVGDQSLVNARRWFNSFGSCSIVEPRDELVAMGLVPSVASAAPVPPAGDPHRTPTNAREAG